MRKNKIENLITILLGSRKFIAIYDFNLYIIFRILYWNLSFKVSKWNSPCFRFLAIYFVHHLIVVASLKYCYSLWLSYITTSLRVLFVFILFTQLTLVYFFFNINVLAIWWNQVYKCNLNLISKRVPVV